MALVIPIHFVEYSFQITHNSDPDPWYVTIGAQWDMTDGVTPTQACVAAGDAFVTAFQETLSEDARFTGVQGRFGQDGDPLTLFVPRSTPGGNDEAMLPQNCAALVTKVTLLGGRKGKGRFYLPGMLREDKVNAVGAIDDDMRTVLQTAVDDFGGFMAGGTPGGAFPDVEQDLYLLHNDYGLDTPDPTPIVALTAAGTIATQRRRLR